MPLVLSCIILESIRSEFAYEKVYFVYFDMFAVCLL